MSRLRKATIRNVVLSSIVSAASAATTVILLSHSSIAQASPMPLRGLWTASQRAAAIRVLTAPPVSESAPLAACVVLQVQQQNDYSQFLQYARMAALNDFTNPNSDQSSIITNLMRAALLCPEQS